MQKRPLVLAILILGVICAVVAVVILSRLRGAQDVAGLVELSEADLKLKIAWDGAEYDVPPPATLPASILQSRAYRKWCSRGNVTRFTGKDEQGNEVVAQALGFLTDRSGTRHPNIPKVSVYRPNGTLLKEASYNPDGIPVTWIIYAQDGKTELTKVWYRASGKPGTPFIREVTFYEADGTARRYVANNADQLVWIEWQLDREGNVIGKLNGGNEFDPDRKGQEQLESQ